MFHIGVATQHPPLPEPSQLSELGINFIKQCLTIDPNRRPSAAELMNHSWIVEFRETLLRYEETELGSHLPALTHEGQSASIEESDGMLSGSASPDLE